MEREERPCDWKKYFRESTSVKINSSNIPCEYNIYKTYSLSKGEKESVVSNVLVFCIHGCGISAMSWATTSIELSKVSMVAAVDLRGHGESFKSFKDSENLSVDILLSDLCKVIGYLLKELFEAYGIVPKLVLLGHSLGAALSVKIASLGHFENILAVVTVDFVEESALQNNFKNTLEATEQIPEVFKSPEDALKWMVESKSISTVKAAKISVLSQLVEDCGVWKWKCHPKNTRKHWKGWIEGTTEKFLNLKCMKVLILKCVDSLSPALTVAHMQGKFQLIPMPGRTHLIHEDAPAEVAKVVSNIISRDVLVHSTLSIA